MRILYKQGSKNLQTEMLNKIGVTGCVFKHLNLGADYNFVSKKQHHHTEFEVHFIKSGSQSYEIEGKPITLNSGDYIIICPNVPHKVILMQPFTEKFSLVFKSDIFDKKARYYRGKTGDRIMQNAEYALKEFSLKKQLSPMLIENAVFEILITYFRQNGFNEKSIDCQDDENATLILVKQYVYDNIESALSVKDVAEYCYLSTKQLTRIFLRYDNITPGEFIRKERVKHIEKLIAENKYTLKQISDKMNFGNEYYFNLFFKQNYGMPPGEYRRMLIDKA